MFRRGTQPGFNTLYRICTGLNVSLSEFFSDEDIFALPLNKETRELVELYNRLPPDKKKLLLAYLRGLCDSELANL